MRKTTLCALLIFGVSILRVEAQQHAPFSARVDLSMALRKGVGGAFEWQYSRRAALALKVSWEEHNKKNGLFNGDLQANFAELKTDTVVGLGDNKIHTFGEAYVGDGRPLPVWQEHIALSSLLFQLGHKFVF